MTNGQRQLKDFRVLDSLAFERTEKEEPDGAGEMELKK